MTNDSDPVQWLEVVVEVVVRVAVEVAITFDHGFPAQDTRVSSAG